MSKKVESNNRGGHLLQECPKNFLKNEHPDNESLEFFFDENVLSAIRYPVQITVQSTVMFFECINSKLYKQETNLTLYDSNNMVIELVQYVV